MAHDEIDLYATALFEEYPPRDQSWNWALDPKHAADDPNVEFEASPP